MGQKNEVIKFTASEDLKQQIQEQAQKKGLSTASYIRMQMRESLPQQVQQA